MKGSRLRFTLPYNRDCEDVTIAVINPRDLRLLSLLIIRHLSYCTFYMIKRTIKTKRVPTVAPEFLLPEAFCHKTVLSAQIVYQ